MVYWFIRSAGALLKAAAFPLIAWAAEGLEILETVGASVMMGEDVIEFEDAAGLFTDLAGVEITLENQEAFAH